jgi:hypothetical protein
VSEWGLATATAPASYEVCRDCWKGSATERRIVWGRIREMCGRCAQQWDEDAMVETPKVSHSEAKACAVAYLKANGPRSNEGKAQWYVIDEIVKRADPDTYCPSLSVLQRYAFEHGIAQTLNVIALAVVEVGDATKAHSGGCVG